LSEVGVLVRAACGLSLWPTIAPCVTRGYNRNLWIEVGVRSVAYPPV